MQPTIGYVSDIDSHPRDQQYEHGVEESPAGPGVRVRQHTEVLGLFHAT
ncbi:hypothetical protein ACFWGI_39120 [Streptomyces niveus]